MHIFHKWSKWSKPLEGLSRSVYGESFPASVQKKICRECKKIKLRFAR